MADYTKMTMSKGELHVHLVVAGHTLKASGRLFGDLNVPPTDPDTAYTALEEDIGPRMIVGLDTEGQCAKGGPLMIQLASEHVAIVEIVCDGIVSTRCHRLLANRDVKKVVLGPDADTLARLDIQLAHAENVQPSDSKGLIGLVGTMNMYEGNEPGWCKPDLRKVWTRLVTKGRITDGLTMLSLDQFGFYAVALKMTHDIHTGEQVPAKDVLLWLLGASVVSLWALPLEPLLMSTGSAGAAFRMRLLVTVIYLPFLYFATVQGGLTATGAASVVGALMLATDYDTFVAQFERVIGLIEQLLFAVAQAGKHLQQVAATRSSAGIRHDHVLAFPGAGR